MAETVEDVNSNPEVDDAAIQAAQEAERLKAEEEAKKKAEADAKAKEKKTGRSRRYFKCREYPGLMIPLSFGPDAEVVRFQPYVDEYKGELIKVGYLATDNPAAIALLLDDGNVEELTAQQYNKERADTRGKAPLSPIK